MSEKLSNLLDKNISQSELDEFLAAYRKDPELAQRWQRYHSVQDLLNNQISDTDLQFDVTAKVMAKVSDDPNPAIDSDTNIEPDSNIVEITIDEKTMVAGGNCCKHVVGIVCVGTKTGS